MIKRLTTPWTLALLVGLLAILSAGQMLAQGVSTPEQGRILPLDESYRALQYAAQIGGGYPFQYNTGDALTTGSTGLLYGLLLGAGFALGIGPDAMPGLVVWLNIGLFALAAALLTDLTRRAADGLLDHSPYAPQPAPVWQPWLAGLLAGLLWAGSGWLVWGALSGAAELLLITLLLATLWAFLTDRVRLTALLGTLAVLTSPGAILLMGLLLAAQLILDPAEYNDRGRRFLWGGVPVVMGLLPTLLSFFLTGNLLPGEVVAHSWLTAQPFAPGAILSAVGTTALILWGRLLGLSAGSDGLWSVFPLMLIFVLLGSVLLGRQGRVREKRLAAACLGWLILGVLGAATLQTAAAQHYRVILPVYAILLIPTAVALVRLGTALADVLWQQTKIAYARQLVAVIGLVLLVAWIAFTLADFNAAYRQDVRAITAESMTLAEWLRANTPAEAQVATADPGVIRYSGERATLDLTGATSAILLEPARHGPGALYEVLEVQQPDYYAVQPAAGPPFADLAAGEDLLGEVLFDTAEGYAITAPDWSAVGLAENPQQPHLLAELAAWTLVDRLDVADLSSEQAHDYLGQRTGPAAGLLTEPRRLAYPATSDLFLTDGGRLLNGGAAFTMQTPDPGQWLLLVARVYQTAPVTLRVAVDGVDGGLWKIPALPDTWLETAFVIRPELVRGTTTRITLQIEDGAVYDTFHYWAYQGDRDPLPPAPGTISEAAFADVVRLRGFDLPGRMFAPGEDLPLTLHWQALDPAPHDQRFVVALIDPQGDVSDNIIAEVGGVPRGGTRPFWTWQPGEAVSDELSLAIPAETPPGEYLLLVSVVDETTGDRLPIIGGDDWGDSRLMLGPLTLR